MVTVRQIIGLYHKHVLDFIPGYAKIKLDLITKLYISISEPVRPTALCQGLQALGLYWKRYNLPLWKGGVKVIKDNNTEAIRVMLSVEDKFVII